MMGQHDRSEALFYYFRLEDQVPETHLLRLIDKHIGFAFVREKLKDSYSETTAGSGNDFVGGTNGYGNVEFNGLPAKMNGFCFRNILIQWCLMRSWMQRNAGPSLPSYAHDVIAPQPGSGIAEPAVAALNRTDGRR
jgi:hypothetical protein